MNVHFHVHDGKSKSKAKRKPTRQERIKKFKRLAILGGLALISLWLFALGVASCAGG